MKKALLRNAFLNAGTTSSRFYLPLLIAIIGSIASFYKIEKGQLSIDFLNLSNLIFVCVMGVGLTLAVTLFSERHVRNHWHKKKLGKWFPQTLLVAVSLSKKGVLKPNVGKTVVGMKNKKTFVILLVIVVLTVAGILAKYFLSVDSCLDSGGRWNYEIKKCEH